MPGILLYHSAGRHHLLSWQPGSAQQLQLLSQPNPGIDPNNLIPGQRICIPVQPPPMGRRCIVMAPTDLAPNADGVLFLDYTDNVVLGTASNVPDPMEFNQEVYKLWLREANTNNWVVTTMNRSPQDVWVRPSGSGPDRQCSMQLLSPQNRQLIPKDQ